MRHFAVTVDPHLVQAFFEEKKECYYPMNFSLFLGNAIASRTELTDQVLSVDSASVQETHEKHVAPIVWLLAKDMRLSHIKRAVIVTDDTYVCFIRDVRPGKCYTHSLPRKIPLPGQDHVVRLSSRH